MRQLVSSSSRWMTFLVQSLLLCTFLGRFECLGRVSEPCSWSMELKLASGLLGLFAQESGVVWISTRPISQLVCGGPEKHPTPTFDVASLSLKRLPLGTSISLSTPQASSYTSAYVVHLPYQKCLARANHLFLGHKDHLKVPYLFAPRFGLASPA